MQLAAGHQRAERQDDGRARNHRTDDRNGLQQGGKEQREISQPGMGRDERNQWIEEGSHKIPVLAVAEEGADLT